MFRNSKSDNFQILLVITVLMTQLFAAVTFGEPAQEKKATLYQRLGGYDGISAFVDTAFPRVAGHPKLQKFFNGHSNDSKYRQRQLIIEFLCRETGGTCVYTGRPMKAVHTGLQITDEDWETFVSIISSTLSELKVGDEERKELLTLFESKLKLDIVEKP